MEFPDSSLFSVATGGEGGGFNLDSPRLERTLLEGWGEWSRKKGTIFVRGQMGLCVRSPLEKFSPRQKVSRGFLSLNAASQRPEIGNGNKKEKNGWDKGSAKNVSA